MTDWREVASEIVGDLLLEDERGIQRMAEEIVKLREIVATSGKNNSIDSPPSRS